ncbi:MAG: plastocyanin/azurin family copper-binding protein [Chitinophagales bacterium]
MKIITRLLLAGIVLLASCGQGESDPHHPKDSSKTTEQAPGSAETVPGVENLPFSDSIQLKADANMRFDKELFRIRAGKKIRLILQNTSAKSNIAMTHNVVILKKGTDIADFAEVAVKARNEEYVPASVSSLIIAHTKSVGGGDSDAIDFTIPEPGVYDFICSFPGHWGTMQGKIVAE